MHRNFIHSFVSGPLGYFHVLDIIKCFNKHWGTCVFWNCDFPQGICSVVGFLGHTLALFLPPKGTSILSPLRLYESTLPLTVQEDSLFSTLSPAFIACRLLKRAILTNVR